MKTREPESDEELGDSCGPSGHSSRNGEAGERRLNLACSEAPWKHPSAMLEREVPGTQGHTVFFLCSLGWLGPHGHSHSRPFGGRSRLWSVN